MTTTALLTDKYELTMIQAAHANGQGTTESVFELFARKLPGGRTFGVVAGMARAVQAVKDFRFTEEQLEVLAADPIFTPETIELFRNYKFKGELWGLRDGDFYFPYTPIITLKGTFADAVVVETVLLSILNHDSAVATAAARMVMASRGLFPIIEMGSRRTHELAAVDSARAAYMVGFSASSNMEAHMRFGVPATGTSAHAFTLLHEDEKDAFRAQVKSLGVTTTLLVDTYDTEQGIRNAVEVAGTKLGGIRIDSGDLVEETFKARELLDSLGATETKIILSSDIDEYTINDLVQAGAPVDGVGAGTRVVTGSGHPTAGMVYKLVQRTNAAGQEVAVAKKASGKKSVGGFKRVYRTYNEAGILTGEHFTTTQETLEGEAVQLKFLEAGEGSYPFTLEEDRNFHKTRMATLPQGAKVVEAASPVVESTQV